jgi:hypothetical protein
MSILTVYEGTLTVPMSIYEGTLTVSMSIYEGALTVFMKAPDSLYVKPDSPWGTLVVYEATLTAYEKPW